MPFDIEGARKAGYTSAEIADYLAQQSGFDVAGARSSGYSDDEVVGFLSNHGTTWTDVAKAVPDVLAASGRATVETARELVANEAVAQREEITRSGTNPMGWNVRPEAQERQRNLLEQDRAAAAEARGEGRAAREDVSAAAPAGMSIPQEAALSVVQSAVPTLAGIGVGILTRNPALAMAIAGGGGGAQGGVHTYGEATDKGAMHRQAARAATIDAVLEGVGEALPLKAALAPGQTFARRLFRTVAAEAGQEAATQVMQDLHAFVTYNPDITVQEAWRNVKVAALAGGMAGSVYGIPGALADPGKGEKPAPPPTPGTEVLALPSTVYPMGSTVAGDPDAVRAAGEAAERSRVLEVERAAEERRVNEAFENLGMARNVDQAILSANELAFAERPGARGLIDRALERQGEIEARDQRDAPAVAEIEAQGVRDDAFAAVERDQEIQRRLGEYLAFDEQDRRLEAERSVIQKETNVSAGERELQRSEASTAETPGPSAMELAFQRADDRDAAGAAPSNRRRADDSVRRNETLSALERDREIGRYLQEDEAFRQRDAAIEGERGEILRQARNQQGDETVARAEVETPDIEQTAMALAFQRAKERGGPTTGAVDAAAHEAATSPNNDRPEPSQAQKDAGNYKVGRVAWNGLQLSIENPEGSERSGTDRGGKAWSVKMPAHYGYIRRTEGADGDHVDVYLGKTPEAPAVYVVDQVDAETRKFDEHKAMLSFASRDDAIQAYQKGFSDGRGAERMGAVTEMPVEVFKAWARSGDTKRALAYKEPPRILGKLPNQLTEKELQLAARKAKRPEQREAATLELRNREQAVVSKRAGAAPDLQRMAGEAGWAEEGGRLIRSGEGASADEVRIGRGHESGEVVGRTQWVPRAEWFQRMRQQMPGEQSHTSPGAIQNAVERYLAGKTLQGKDRRTIDWMLEEIEAERDAWAEQQSVDLERDVSVSDLVDAGVEVTGANMAEVDAFASMLETLSAEEIAQLDERFGHLADVEFRDAVLRFLKEKDRGNHRADASQTEAGEEGNRASEDVQAGAGEDEEVDGPRSNAAASAPEPDVDADEKHETPSGAAATERDDQGAAQQREPRTRPDDPVPAPPAGGEQRPALELEQQTPENLEREERLATLRAQREAAEAQKAVADQQLANFRLEGSSRPVDGARAAGQEELESAETPGVPAVKQQLFVVRGSQRFPVESIEDASEKWETFRDTTGAGASQIGEGATIVDQDGKEIARISYNGRIWPPGEWTSGTEPLYKPKRERRTPEQIAEHEAFVAGVKAEAEQKRLPAADRITDAGENLWANRRNWTAKALGWDDVKDLNDTLKLKEVVKAKVWPRPDYEQLITDGLQPIIARLVKQVYDGIGTSPSGKSDADLQRYITTVHRIRDAVLDWAKDSNANRDFLKAMGARAERMLQRRVNMMELLGDQQSRDMQDVILDRVWPDTKGQRQRFARGTEALSDIRVIGGNRALKALQLTLDDTVGAMKEIEKGWPASREAWQRQGFQIAPSSQTRVVEGSRYGPGDERTAIYSLMTAEGWKGQPIGTYQTRQVAELDQAALKPFMLLDKRSRLVSQYDTEEEAKEAARERTKREAKGGDLRGMNVADAERQGPARREEGDNVSAERLMQAFGFRGVNFGREGWINQAERQAYLNHAYDGLIDLAEILGIPPKALSLNGMLGIAFGAQGRGGRAAAHFVPGHNEINLTKTMGAGTLAHEWGHALDHYFATQAGLAKANEPYMSAGGRVAGEIRPEIAQAFKNVVEAMRRRPMTAAEVDASNKMADKRALNDTETWIQHFRKGIERVAPEALADFDALAERIRKGDLGDGYVKVFGQSLPKMIGDIKVLVRTRAKTSGADIASNYKGLTSNAEHLAYRLSKKDASATHVPQSTASAYAGESYRKDHDKGGQKYWSTEWEMFARAFETWVADQLAESAQQNTFLSDAAIRAEQRDRSGGYAMPYPRGEDRARINGAMGKLVDAIETRDTDRGVEMFSRGRDGATGINRAAFDAALAEAFGVPAARRLTEAGVIEPLDTQDQLPDHVVPLLRHGDTVYGFYDPRADRTYAVLENLEAADVRGLVLHEVGVHYGFERMLGAEKYAQVLKRMVAMRKAGNQAVRAAYETAETEAATEDQIAEEALAYLVQRQPEMGLVREIIAAIKAFLFREFGIGGSRLTTDDMVMLARAAVMRAGLQLEAGALAPAFARTGSENSGRFNMAMRRMDEMVTEYEKGRLKDETSTHLGETSWALQLLGAPARNLYITGSVLRKVLDGKHGYQITPDMVRQMPAQLLEPMMVFAPERKELRDRGALVVLTEITDVTGKPVIIPVHVDVHQSRIVANEIASIYGHEGGIAKMEAWAEAGLLQYYDRAKTADPATTLRLSPADRERVPHVVQLGLTANPNLRSDADVVKTRGAMFSRARWISGQSPASQEALRKAGVWYTPATLKDRVKEWAADWDKRLKQGIVDQFDPIKELDYKAYMLARMTRGADNALEGLLRYGTVRLDQDGAVDINFEQGGFLGIMSSLNGEHDRFLAWVIGNRAERLKAEGRENNFSDADIRELKGLNQGRMPDGKARPQEYARARAALDRYNKAVMDVAEKAGLIDGAVRSAWEKDFYVPFYRLMEDDGAKGAGPVMTKGLVNQYAFKVLKGGTEELGDPLENVLRNWAHLLDASLKNQAAKASLLAAERVGAAIETDEATARQIAKSLKNSRGAVSFVDQGKQRWFVIDDAFLLDALRSIGFVGFQGPAMKMMQNFKRWLTLGVTVSPTFRIRNVIRDSLSMIGANPASYNVLSNVLTGWKATKGDTAEYASLLAGGGIMRFGTYLEGDRARNVKRLIEAGVDDKTILTTPEKTRAALRAAWDWWQRVGDRAENINRAALYKKLRADGMSHLEASFRARDVMDFSMQGTWAAVRFLTQTVPFMNARLQGLYKLGRGAAEDPRRFGIVLGATALASIALLLAYQDDDDWKQREDWDRETFWWFKVGDTAYRIPKPFEIGVIGSIAERGLEAMMSDELTGKQFASRVFSMVSEQLSLNPVPQLAKPLVELYANRNSFTDRPIESMGMERLSKAERVGPGTSATAQLLGKNGVVSPVQIDHLVRGYFGWLGGHIVAAADLALRPAMDLPGKAAWKVDDVLVAGDFVQDLPAYQSKYVTRLYDQMKDVQEATADLKHLQRIGATERAQQLLEERRDKLRMAPLFNSAERQLSDINRQIRLVQARSGDAEMKRERLDALYAARNRLAKVTERRAAALQR